MDCLDVGSAALVGPRDGVDPEALAVTKLAGSLYGFGPRSVTGLQAVAVTFAATDDDGLAEIRFAIFTTGAMATSHGSARFTRYADLADACAASRARTVEKRVISHRRP